jgi:hypothetical protein
MSAIGTVSGGPCCVRGTGSCSKGEFQADVDVVVPGIAFQHRVPQCLVCIVYEIHALAHFLDIRKLTLHIIDYSDSSDYGQQEFLFSKLLITGSMARLLEWQLCFLNN